MLIDNGTDRKEVRIRGNHLYVGQRLHGPVNNHSFVKSPTLGDFDPSSNALSDANVCQSSYAYNNHDLNSLSQSDDDQSVEDQFESHPTANMTKSTANSQNSPPQSLTPPSPLLYYNRILEC